MKRLVVIVLLCMALTSCGKRLYYLSGIDEFHGVSWHGVSGTKLVSEDSGELHIALIVNELRDSTRTYGIIVTAVTVDWLFLSPQSKLEVSTDGERFVLNGSGSRDARDVESYWSKPGTSEVAQFNSTVGQLNSIANSSEASFTLRTAKSTITGTLNDHGKRMFRAFMNRHVTLDPGPR